MACGVPEELERVRANSSPSVSRTIRETVAG